MSKRSLDNLIGKLQIFLFLKIITVLTFWIWDALCVYAYIHTHLLFVLQSFRFIGIMNKCNVNSAPRNTRLAELDK